MDNSKYTTFKKYIISLRNINTGESKNIPIQINQSIEVVKLMANYFFDKLEYTLEDITEVPSIVQIAIEPYCTN